MDRRRGAPRATTHAAIRGVAHELFREVGFEATTMPMIAERAGIGRSTLFRYFSSKAEILWSGYADLTAEFGARLDAQPAEAGLVDGAFAACRSLWADSPEATALGKDITRILETAPPEATGRWRLDEAWSDLLHAYVRARTGRPADDVAARAAATAIWAAMWTAVAAFARSEAESIDGHLAEARASIEVRLPPRISPAAP